MRKTLTKNQISYIEENRNVLTARQIAENLNVKYYLVGNYIRETGENKKSLTEEQKLYIDKNRDLMTLSQITEALGVKQYLVVNYIRETGGKKYVMREELKHRSPQIQKALEYLSKHPEKSISEIANMFGVYKWSLTLAADKEKLPYAYGNTRRSKEKYIEDIKKAIKELEDNPLLSYQKIREKYGVTEDALRKHALPYKTDRKRWQVQDSNVQHVADYIKTHPGHTRREYAKLLNVPYVTVQKAISLRDIKQYIKNERDVDGKIKDYIITHPGLTIKKISLKTNMPYSSVLYHVKKWNLQDLIRWEDPRKGVKDE